MNYLTSTEQNGYCSATREKQSLGSTYLQLQDKKDLLHPESGSGHILLYSWLVFRVGEDPMFDSIRAETKEIQYDVTRLTPDAMTEYRCRVWSICLSDISSSRF